MKPLQKLSSLFFCFLVLCAGYCVAQYNPPFIVAVDVQETDTPFVINRTFTGNSLALAFDITDGGTPISLTGWTFSFKFGYDQDAEEGMTSVAGSNTASNRVLFVTTSNVLFSADSYYASLIGTSASGYTRTFATGLMIEAYDPATGSPSALSFITTVNWANYDYLNTASSGPYRITGVGVITVTNTDGSLSVGIPTGEGGATNLSPSGVVTGHYDSVTRTMIVGSDMSGYATGTPVYVESDPVFTSATFIAECIGGSYFTDWFSWEASKTAISVPDTETTTTNQDSIILSEMYDGASYDYSIYAPAMRGTNALVLDSSSPGVATAGTYRVYRVTDGTTTVTGVLGEYSRETNLIFVASWATTNYIITNGVAGSARKVMTDAIDTRLTGDIALLTNYVSPYTNIYRNPDCWAADFDLTCASPWNSYHGRYRAGTLVSSNVILFANHWAVPNGTTVRFLDMTNGVHDLAIAAQAVVSGTDCRVAVTSGGVDTNLITPAVLLPTDWGNYIPQHYGIALQIPLIAFDAQEHACIIDWLSGSSLALPLLSARLAYYEPAIGGDSGNPLLLLTSTSAAPVLVTTYTSPIVGPNLSSLRSQIMTTVASLGGDTNITTIDLSGYTDYHSEPPTP